MNIPIGPIIHSTREFFIGTAQCTVNQVNANDRKTAEHHPWGNLRFIFAHCMDVCSLEECFPRPGSEIPPRKDVKDSQGHSMTEKELSMRPNPHEDGETIAEEDVEEEEAGEVEKEVTVIPPRLKITKPSKDESNTSNEPRKKRTLRNQPPPGKDIHEYVKEKKDAPQKDESGMCAYCGFGPHKAKACSYLAE
ncbi:unnamed protein product [Penicillium roqueforti FM164]|uniref:Genomic scaffold, ProqFM164S02 n=1 Tax=Penicillium roqueforti (strain FM164) TaxID=1365484 RepID=W6Q8Z8_PENRF|nr:unnamed protein product [Penicillium roqueforti FM164]